MEMLLRMERIPTWVLWVAAVVFAALAVWSATDENWTGLIIGAALAMGAGMLAMGWRPTGR
jgi:hypothetical protein